MSTQVWNYLMAESIWRYSKRAPLIILHIRT